MARIEVDLMKNTEIERKYLVKYMPKKFYAYSHRELEQAYLSYGDGDDGLEKRVRLMRSGASEHYFYTEKSAGTLSRDEYEIEIGKKEYLSLCNQALSKFVKKARYYIPVDEELVAELDVYHGELTGLVTVEVEFKSIEQSDGFSPPEWFGDEITEDVRYKNRNLAQNGKPE